MMEVMNFVFSSFWVWLGTVILIGSISGGLVRGLAVIGLMFKGR